jgi:hypothetical protein
MTLCVVACGAFASSGCAIDSAGSSGCAGFVPSDNETFISAVQACTIAAEAHVSSATSPLAALKGPTCNTVCGSTSVNCTLPGYVLSAYLAGQSGAAEGGATVDASADGGDAASETGNFDAGNAGDASTAACPGIDPAKPIPLICTSTCGQ